MRESSQNPLKSRRDKIKNKKRKNNLTNKYTKHDL